MTSVSKREPHIRISNLYLSSFEKEEYRLMGEFIKKHYNNPTIPLKRVYNNCMISLICKIIEILESNGIPKKECCSINRVVYVLYSIIELDKTIINECINHHLIKNEYTTGNVVLSR